MPRRPALLSIMGGYLSLFSVYSIYTSLRQVFQSDDPVYKLDSDGDLILGSISPMVFLVMSIIGFVCAVNILDGANWSRWLYAALCIVLVIYELIIFPGFPVGVYIGIVSRIGMIIILFLPASNDFFKIAN